MKKILIQVSLSIIALFGLIACEEVSDMAIDRVASPVLVMVSPAVKTTDLVTVTATFYELDKSGILDKNVGIDSIPVPGLAIKVNKYGGAPLGTLTTDAQGKVTFTAAPSALTGVSRLEWQGEHKGVKFLQMSNL